MMKKKNVHLLTNNNFSNK